MYLFFFFYFCRYLLTENVISAAITHNCTMLHPGYGFLAENAEFVDLCKTHGVNFIGPEVEFIASKYVSNISSIP